MPTSLITIARTGAAAARADLELTAQNIANASNPDYSRRRLGQAEHVGTANVQFQARSTLNGVLVEGTERIGNDFAQRQVRASMSDLARAESELGALRGVETALEQTRIYEGLVGFEAALTLLESDPTDPALRTGALETARQLAQSFQSADFALANTRDLAAAQLATGADTINGLASELARVNVELVSAHEGTAGRAALLDARDAALRDLADQVGIDVTLDAFGSAEVRILSNPAPAGEAGVLLVSGSGFSMLTANESGGAVTLNANGVDFVANSGQMAGIANALADISVRQADLDDIAAQTIARANAAQAVGSALDGSGGQPLFSGSDAGSIRMVLADGSGLALAPAGSPAGSRDTANLGNLIAALGADDGPIVSTDRTLLSLSSKIAGLATTSDGLAIIKQSAESALFAETGVDLDTEAASLVRLQQAFEANSRVIQVATELFDTILGLR
ncbi:flagellar hook-associated protein FlgK [Qipengyuania nanhaisediminis]|uniref:flagellar hook-associated protein FlgK n=1 Tax=Qipengyuania nanhaisediminis TaxID=604088 RepID=UPI0038B2B592